METAATSFADTPAAPAGPALSACHVCDALLADIAPPVGQRSRCPRCGSVLATARLAAVDAPIAIALVTLALTFGALTLPFVGLEGGGIARDARALDAAIAAGAEAWPLALAVGAAIAIAPAARALAILAALGPIRLGRRGTPLGRAAFRLALEMRPWCMAEVFVIGVAVALVKVAGLATVTLGPAFWMFGALGFAAMAEDAVLCPRTLWSRLA